MTTENRLNQTIKRKRGIYTNAKKNYLWQEISQNGVAQKKN